MSDRNQRVTRLTDDIKFVHRLGGSVFHLVRTNHHMQAASALCGCVMGAPGESVADGRFLLSTLPNYPYMPLKAVCKRCVAVAAKRSPALVMLQSYTDADRHREQQALVQAMERIFPSHPRDI